MEKNKLNVIYFSSDLFASVAAVSILSLLENNREFEDISVYVVDDGITAERKKLLEEMVASYHRSVTFLPAPDPTEFFKFPFKDKYQMGHTYMRMCVGSLLPESVDRLLCMDSDTLVRGSLYEMWNIEMKDNVLAGVADCVNVKAFKKQFMLEATDPYCNAGMFLVNLSAWRNDKIEDSIRNIIKQRKGNIFFFEQTLMNLACRGKIIVLPPRYNSYTLFYAFSYKNLITWRKPTTFYTEEEVQDAVTNAIIIHFTRNFYMTSRPWVRNCDHPMTSEYLKYKSMTPWKNLQEDIRKSFERIRYKLIHVLPQNVLAYAVNILYNTVRPLLFWKNE